MATAHKIETTILCEYGCGQIAQWQFKQGKLCCSASYNSCPEKRRRFSEEVNHTEYTAKSLATRKRLGITKQSQIKATITRRGSGHYDRLASRMQELWAERPWNNQCRAGFNTFKETDLPYQGSYEFCFLEGLEQIHGLQWIKDNVQRGPAIWYNHPLSNERRLYLPDFLIDKTIYEVKSGYTWNCHGLNQNLELLNQTKLKSAKEQGFDVVLILDHKEIRI